jgi:hypothetical protein
MRVIYLPDNPLAALGRALFYVAYGWLVKYYQDHGMDPYGPRMRELHRAFDGVIWTWPVAFVIGKEGNVLVEPQEDL